MNQIQLNGLLNKFKTVSRSLTYKWGVPYNNEDFYSAMCLAFVRKNGCFKHKPMAFVIKVCKNEALNDYFKGKSICSKPRKGIRIVSFDKLSEEISVGRRFEEDVHNMILVERILEVLTGREKQVAELIMEGDNEQEISAHLGISQQRVSFIKKRIRIKATRILSRQLYF